MSLQPQPGSEIPPLTARIALREAEEEIQCDVELGPLVFEEDFTAKDETAFHSFVFAAPSARPRRMSDQTPAGGSAGGQPGDEHAARARVTAKAPHPAHRVSQQRPGRPCMAPAP